MPAPFRNDSFLDRLFQRAAGTTYLPPSLQTVFQREYGLPPTFKPEQTQEAYGDNPWLYSAVNVIANEVARTQFRLVEKTKAGTKDVESHQALDTLFHPQPVEGGKSLLTRHQLFFLLAQYLL